MAEIADTISTFIREYPLIVLGIMALVAFSLILDREMTFLCPSDQSAMERTDENVYLCNRCGLVKRV